MGINIDRGQQRTGEKSWWCNLGVNEFRENDGHWVDVLPPPRQRELKLLPYLIGGYSKQKQQTECILPVQGRTSAMRLRHSYDS